MKTIEDLIKWFEENCMDGMTESKDILNEMFNLQAWINDNSSFDRACEPLMKYLCENHHPHTKVIVDGNTAELLEGIKFIKNDAFIVD